MTLREEKTRHIQALCVACTACGLSVEKTETKSGVWGTKNERGGEEHQESDTVHGILSYIESI